MSNKKTRNSSFLSSTMNTHKKAPHRGRKTESSFSLKDSTTQNSNDLLYHALMSDPLKRAMVLELLASQRDAILEYKKKEQANMNRLKSKVVLESPTALLRRRALQQANGEQSSSPTSMISRQSSPSPTLRFDKILVGIKAFVDVMSQDEDRSAGVKALLMAMGADVKDTFTNDVTHVIFKDGSFETFQRATKLKTRVISVLWVEAVRTKGFRVPEADYPALGTDNFGLDASVICEKLQNDYKEIINDEMRKSVAKSPPFDRGSSTVPHRRIEYSQKLTELCDRWRSSPSNSLRLSERFSEDIIPGTQDYEVASIASRKVRKSNASDKLPSSDSDSDCGVIDGRSFNRSNQNLLENDCNLISRSVRKSLFNKENENEAPIIKNMDVNDKRISSNSSEDNDDIGGRPVNVRDKNNSSSINNEDNLKVLDVADAFINNKRQSLESVSCSEEIGAYITIRRATTKTKVDFEGFKIPEKCKSVLSNNSSLRTSNETNISNKRKSSTSTEDAVPSLRISSDTERSRQRSSISTATDLSSLRISQSSEDVPAVSLTVTALVHSEPQKQCEDKENEKIGSAVRRSTRFSTSIRFTPTKEVINGAKNNLFKMPTNSKASATKLSINKQIGDDFILTENFGEGSVHKSRRKRKLFDPKDIDENYLYKLDKECVETDTANKRISFTPVKKSDFNAEKQIESIINLGIDKPTSPTVNPVPLHGFILTESARLAVTNYLESLSNNSNTKTPRRTKKNVDKTVEINSSLFEQKQLLQEVLDKQNAVQKKTPEKDNNNDSVLETPNNVRNINDSLIIEETPIAHQDGEAYMTPKTSSNIVPSGVTTRRRTQRIISGMNEIENMKISESKKIVQTEETISVTPKTNDVVNATTNKKIIETPRSNKAINKTPKSKSKQTTPKPLKSAIKSKTPANKKEVCKTPKSVQIVANSPIRKSTRKAKAEENLNDSLPIKPDLNRRSTMEFMPIEDNKTPKKMLSQKVRPKNATIVCSRFKSQEVEVFLQIVKKLGEFNVENEVTNRTTHLVVAENSRTINVLKAIARGIWVLKSEWLYSSLEKGKWLPEESFELTEFSPAVQLCRIQRQTFGSLYSMDVFQNCGPIYVSRSSSPRCSDLEDLIKLGKGKIASVARNASIVVGECLRHEKISYVKETWLLDCITFNKCKTLKNYQLEL